MLPDGPDVLEVVAGEAGVLAGADVRLVVDMSTIAPRTAVDVATRCRERGVSFLDAPVSGGEQGAIDAALSIMVGGSPEDFERARPLFEALGRTVVHVGDIGSGQVAKACNQLVVAATIEAVGEALSLAQKWKVDAGKVREALLGGLASSRILEIHGLRMLERAFEPGFRARLHAKDAHIIVEAARQVEAPIPSFDVVAARLDQLVAAGGGDLDHSALFTLL